MFNSVSIAQCVNTFVEHWWRVKLCRAASLMPGFHHSVAVLRIVAVSPFCRCKIPLFCKKLRKKIPFRCSRKRQKDTQRQRQRQRCTETATANGNGDGETTREERQRNGGNQALVVAVYVHRCRCIAYQRNLMEISFRMLVHSFLSLVKN